MARSSDERAIHRYPREDVLEEGQLVYIPDVGLGEIVAVDGVTVTVRCGKRKLAVDAHRLVTRVRAEVEWHSLWLTGAKKRFEEGKLLRLVKALCRHHGEWQAFLNRYDIPRSTADDLIRRYLTSLSESDDELPGYRAIALAKLDRDSAEHAGRGSEDELEELVRSETRKRSGMTPSSHATLWSVRIKLPPDVLERCREKYKADGNEAKEYWRRKAYEFVDLEPDESEAERSGDSSDEEGDDDDSDEE
jgi:hypothetical protein